MKGARAVGTRTFMGRSRRQLVEGFLGNRSGVNYSSTVDAAHVTSQNIHGNSPTKHKKKKLALKDDERDKMNSSSKNGNLGEGKTSVFTSIRNISVLLKPTIET